MLFTSSIKKDNEDSCDYKKNETVYFSSPITQVTQQEDTPSLYPPGRILHIVRKYPRAKNENIFESNQQKKESSTFQIIEADNRSFHELLISPRMLQDHMPQSILNAMKAVSIIF